MASNVPSSIQLRSVSLATAMFLGMGFFLGVLTTYALRDMQAQATLIDDTRASRAADAAVRSLASSLSATVRDNAVWDDAYNQVGSAEASTWIYENWGKPTLDYPLYDIAVVMTPQEKVLAAYKKGVPFDPLAMFGPDLLRLVNNARAAGQAPTTSFLQSGGGTYLVGVDAIQPYEGQAPGQKSVLLFAKLLSPAVISQLEETFGLDGLHLAARPNPKLLSFPLVDAQRGVVQYLQWESRRPGALIYDHVYRYLLAATAVLVSFMCGILATGVMAARGLQRLAKVSEHKATHDDLTGLLNRAGMLLAVEDAIRNGGTHWALYLIDLDGFKDVNDSWGHAVGDQLIKLVAARLEGQVNGNASVARLGGDEFAILCPTGEHEIEARVLRCLKQRFRIGGRTLEVGASIGRVQVGPSAGNAYELLRRADMALYQAKDDGRGRSVHYHPEMDLERDRRAALEDKLRTAIAAGDVKPSFQPLYNARSGRLSGVEALARWSPGGQAVSPDVFIPIAERAGLIDDLGMSIMRSAVEQAREWDDVGLSVNVSPVQLRNPDFACDVASLLEEQDFPPGRLTLEITEGVLMTNPEQSKRAITSLKKIGVKFALDDFGSGYASIGTLREFGFDRMKIDRSLVQALADHQGAQVLFATISLANALDIPVTAEGVETRNQAEMLVRYGCDQLQGYLLGRPMPGSAIKGLLLAAAA